MDRLEKGLVLFEQGQYDLAMQNLIAVYNNTGHNQQVLNFIYDCFITPNEEEFLANYNSASSFVSGVPFDMLMLDFIPVNETKYYIFSKVKKEFCGYIDVSFQKKISSESEMNLLVTDAWNFNLLLNLLQEYAIHKFYVVLPDEKELFFSFFKLKEIKEIVEQNLVLFENRRAMTDYFLQHTAIELPELFVGENIKKEQRIIGIIQKMREEQEKGNRAKSLKVSAYDVFKELCDDLLCDKKTTEKENMAVQYQLLTAEEKKALFSDIEECLQQDRKLYMYILTYLLSVTSDNDVLLEIGRILVSYDYTIEEYLSLNFALTNLIFTNTKLGSQEIYKNRLTVRKKYCDQITDNLKEYVKYIPYNNRNKKRVVLLVEPFLGEKHAPTSRAINLYMVLKDMGYETIIISSSILELNLFYADLTYEPKYMNSLTRNTQMLSMNCFGKTIELKNYYYTNQNFLADLESAVSEVRNYNPEFIIEVGGNNILADICSKFTTVLSRSCAATLPVTLSKYVLDFFEDETILGNQVLAEQCLIKIPNVTIFQPLQEPVVRSQYNLSAEDFVIAIAGNRLDHEITEDFLAMLQRVLDKNEKVKILFIGTCHALEQRLKTNPQMFFSGFVESFANTIEICDVFVNPPRQGGGTGAILAFEKSIPVLTLSDCDVASYVGEEFVCQNIYEMENCLERYIIDKEFYEKQRKACHEIHLMKTKTLDTIREEMTVFCENVKEHIFEDEKGMLSYDSI